MINRMRLFSSTILFIWLYYSRIKRYQLVKCAIYGDINKRWSYTPEIAFPQKKIR